MHLLEISPWYVAPLLTAFVFVLLTWIFPGIWPMPAGDPVKDKSPVDVIFSIWVAVGKNCAPIVAAFMLFIWGLAELLKLIKRRQFESLRGLQDIRDLDWQKFELLLCEVFRRQGYRVEHTGKDGPDGGIDLRLVKGKQLSLVQCKHWRAWQVGVRETRELLGVVTSEKAEWGVLVTSGTFTAEALAFAEKNHIQLIDGDELMPLIRSVQIDQQAVKPVQAVQATSAADASCPKCGGTMVIKTARKGPNPGSQFYSCSAYPRCDGKRPL